MKINKCITDKELLMDGVVFLQTLYWKDEHTTCNLFELVKEDYADLFINYVISNGTLKEYDTGLHYIEIPMVEDEGKLRDFLDNYLHGVFTDNVYYEDGDTIRIVDLLKHPAYKGGGSQEVSDNFNTGSIK